MSEFNRNPMKQLFNYINPFYIRLRLSILASCSNKVLDLMPPLLVAWVIDSVNGSPPNWIQFFTGTNDALTLAIFLAILGVFIFGFESLFQWLYNYGFLTLAQKVQHKLRMDTYKQIQKREMAFFENHRLGNTLAILNDDINQLERFLNTAFNELVQLSVTVLFATYVMMTTAWQLGAIALLPVPVVILGSFFYQKKNITSLC